MANNTEKRDVIITLSSGKALSSIKDLEGAMRGLRKEFKQTSDESKRSKIAAEMKKINGELGKQYSMTRAAQGGWKQLSSTIMKAGGILAGMVGFQMVTDQIGNLIKRGSELSDSMADVRKTTGLTDAEVKQLDKSLRQIDTRTSRRELLSLARDAGKLGKDSVADVKKFVEQADIINVALGEDLGDGALVTIGKLSNIFKTEMLNIASSINTVGASSEASEPALVEFLSRLGGIATTAKLSAPDIIGYGATLDSLGLKAEMSTTALNRFFIDFVKNTEEFGRIAGFAEGELSKLVGEEGTNQGFIAFLEKLREANPESQQFLQKLEQLGIDGARGSQVFLTLANNTQRLREQQDIANQSFDKGSSVIDEFNVKNNNFAANINRIQKAIAQTFTSGGLMKSIERMAGQITDLLPKQESYTQELSRTNREFNAEIEVLKRANFSQDQRGKFIKKINEKYEEYLPNLIDEQATLEEIEAIQKKVNDQMMSRILLASYEEEIKEILEEQKQSIEALYNIEVERAKLRAGQDPIKDNATLAEQRAFQLKQMEELNELMVNSTEKRTKDVEAKYEAMAERLGLVFQDIKKALNEVVVTDDEDGGGDGDGGDDLSEAQKKALAKSVAETKKLVQQLRDVKIEAINDVERREIVALKEAFRRERDKIEQTTANEEVKNDLIFELEQKLQSDITEVQREASEERIKKEAERIQAANDSELFTLELRVDVAEEGSLEQLQALGELMAKQMEMELSSVTLTKEQRLLIEQDYLQRFEKLWDEFDESQKLKQEERTLSFEESMEVMTEANDGFFDSISQGFDRQITLSNMARDKEIENLQIQHDRGIISKKTYDKQREKLEKKYAAEERAIKRKQFEVDRVGRIASATIAMAQAINVAMTGGPYVGQVLAGITAALAGVQIGYIASEPNPYFRGSTDTIQDSTGRTHRAQNIGPIAQGGLVSTPSLGILGDQGTEMIVPNWLYTHPDYSDTMSHLANAIDRGYPTSSSASIAQLDPTTTTTSPAAATQIAAPPADPELKAMLARNTALLERLERNGVTGRWEWEDYKNGILTQEDIDGKNYFSSQNDRTPGKPL